MRDCVFEEWHMTININTYMTWYLSITRHYTNLVTFHEMSPKSNALYPPISETKTIGM